MGGRALPERANPCCGHLVDTLSGIGDCEATPGPGDIGICINCGALLCYEDEEGASHVAWDWELGVLDARELEVLRRAQRFIESRGRAPS